MNLTPMIDVVFLLIMFFIVSNNMIQQDTAIAVDLPMAESGIPPQEQQTRQLTLTIPQPGMIYVGAMEVDGAELRRILVDCRRDWGEEAEVLIRTNKDIPFGEIRPILQMAAESGITPVSFVVSPRL